MRAYKAMRQAFAEGRSLGASIEPAMAHCALDDARYYPLYALCCDHDLPLLVTAGLSPHMPGVLLSPTSPAALDKVATDFPDLRILVSHGGYPWAGETIAVCLRHRNIYLDFSSSINKPGGELYVKAANDCLADRFVFSSANPFVDVDKALEQIGRLGLSDEAMRPDIKESLCTQFFFWCILDEKEGPILVDQSFTQRCLDEMKIPYQVKEGPLELLDRINVRPEDVRHVILSHLHWDHYAGDEFYPNARYHVHQKELEYVTGPLMRFTTYAQHYNFKAIEHLLHLHFSGRVHLVQDEREEICEGITCLRTGGHTPGLMSVAVETEGGTKIICSDVVPRYRNISEMTPYGIHYGHHGTPSPGGPRRLPHHLTSRA